MQNIRISTNTKHISNGDVFFCFKSAEQYLVQDDVLDKASKVFCEKGFLKRALNSNVISKKSIDKYCKKIYEIQDLNKELILQLKKQYKIPSNLIGVTGTKGKTSTSWFTMQLFGKCGFKIGYIGTLGAYFYDGFNISKINKNDTLTTPSIDDIYYFLNDFYNKGANYVVFEVSSHALEQGRIDGLHINCGVFTNLSQDHLDYHKTMEKYFEAKTLLFSKYQLKDDKCILNADDCKFEQLKAICKNNCLDITTVGSTQNADFKIITIKQEDKFQNVIFEYNNKQYNFRTQILGEFQIYNLLESLAITQRLLNQNIETLCDKITTVQAPIGRMQQVKETNIFIDFAHTPKSLEESIKLLKNRYQNVITVFGCGGNRDKQKRPIMCEIALKLSNFVIITTDNQRLEEPSDIINDIVCFQRNNTKNELLKDEYVINEILAIDKKYNNKKCNFEIITDRKEAIKYATINYLNKKNTAVVIAGKGHENYQIIGKIKYRFSDFEEVEKYLNRT